MSFQPADEDLDLPMTEENSSVATGWIPVLINVIGFDAALWFEFLCVAMLVSLTELRESLTTSYDTVTMLDKVTRAMEFAADEMEKHDGQQLQG